MRIKFLIHAPIPFAFMMACCSIIMVACMNNLDLSQGGSGTEIGNPTVTGRVVDENGVGAANTRISLYPYDYDPARGVEVKSAITDALGSYSLQNVGSGTYNIIAVGLVSRMKSILCGINVSEDPVALPNAVLRRPGTIKVALPDTLGARQGFVYIPGTNIVARRNGAVRSVLLDSVPSGLVPPVYFAGANDTVGAQLAKDSITVDPADTAYVAYPAWKFSKTLSLNTTAAGAGIAGTVMNFPLLIRLNSANFPFGQAKSDGGDLRFTKANGAPLPYEIERWDPSSGGAEIWVKIDTVFGNDDTHRIVMYWGASAVSSAANGTVVFDTSNGFAGVWHLGENIDSVHDATADFFNGMNSGTTPTTGMIGNARSFTNGKYIKITGLLKSPANVTFSAWVSSDTLNWGQNNNWGQEIVSIGDYAGIRLDDAFGIGTSGWYQNKPIGPGPDSSFIIVNSGRFLANAGWHFVAFSINTATYEQALYIDGVRCAIANDVNPIYYSGLGSDTYIGIHGNGEKIYNFSGRIDEVRVNKISLSPDWIKLCFMNQKEQDALVKW